MPLLDGKYEILTQRPLGALATLFEATAPDGTALRVVWFDLVTPEQEVAFESYRRLLRKLKRAGYAAIYDLVSRPGAHYVAWYPPPAAPAPTTSAPLETDELQHLLQTHGYNAEEADIRKDERGERVYGLAFEGVHLTPQAPPELETSPALPLQLEGVPDRLLPWLPGAALALLGGVLLVVTFGLWTSDALVVLPELTGENINEASERLYRLGLSAEPRSVPSNAPAGSVIGLDPDPGSQLRTGSRVVVRYALPQGRRDEVAVPDLVGLTLSPELRAELSAEGLTLAHIARIPSNKVQGVILSQHPTPGSRLEGGETLHLLVSEGRAPEVTFVPDLTGLDLETARELARDAGLALAEPESVPAPRLSAGTVVEQNIAPNTTVPRDDAVLRLLVAAGARDASNVAPNLIGLSLEEAEQTAVAAGFRAEASRELATPSLPQGVVAQSPAPGEPASSERLELTLNLHPVTIPIPRVRTEVKEPEPRLVPYTFYIEPGIPEGTALVTASVGTQRETTVRLTRAGGGDTLSGDWATDSLGPVTFELSLNGIPYKTFRVNP